MRLDVRETSLGQRWGGLVDRTLAVSATGHLAYVVKSGDGEAVVLDGKAGKRYDSIPVGHLTEAGFARPLVFSQDGNRLAYVALSDGRARVVVDGAEGPPFDQIAIGAPAFSADGRRLVYVAQRSAKSIAVVDGVESRPYDRIDERSARFSPDRWNQRRLDPG